MMAALLLLWAAWCAANLLCMALVVPRVPAFTGFRVIIPASLASVLKPDEIDAVTSHEHGHRHHGHVWKNFLLVCAFMRAGAARRASQEIEADDYAAQRGHAEALASALRKRSTAAFDIYRAARLEIA